MARLRFPGRPGCRFDRLGVRYGADEARNAKDPTLIFVANIHRGLLQFRELCGPSDEEEEFEGFTPIDIKESAKKLRKALAASRESFTKESISPSGKKTIGTRIAHKKETLEQLPTSDRTRSRERTVVNKSYKALIKEGLTKPSKPFTVKHASAREETLIALKRGRHARNKTDSQDIDVAKIRKKDSKLIVDFKIKRRGRPPLDANKKREKAILSAVKETKKTAKKDAVLQQKLTRKGKKEKLTQNILKKQEKFKKKVKERDKIPLKKTVVPASKIVRGNKRQLAKQLLEKARKGQQQIAKETVVSTPKSPKTCQRKQFVLPTQSSRSSRVIIPNKRFLEDDSFHALVAKRSQEFKTPDRDHGSAAFKSPTSSNVERVKESFKSPTTTNVERVKESPSQFPELGGVISPAATTSPMVSFEPGLAVTGFVEPKASLYDQPLIIEGKRERKPSLKVRMKLSDENFQDFPERVLDRSKDSRRSTEFKSPESEVQHSDSAIQVSESKKVHLTPSKLSGSMSSPGNLPTSPIFAPPKFGVGAYSSLSERTRLVALEKEALATRRKGHNILRKAKLQLNRAALNRSSADLARTLKKEMKKEAKLNQLRQQQMQVLGGFGKLPGYSTFAGITKSYMDAQEGNLVCAVCNDPEIPKGSRALYYGTPSCEGCRRFYRLQLRRIKERTYKCKFKGKCEITFETKMSCTACRFAKCQLVFPEEDKLQKVVRVKSPVKEASPQKRPHGKDETEELQIDAETVQSPSTAGPMSPTMPSATTENSLTVPVSSSPECTTSPNSEVRGPRIKHVCRKAAVVLGKPVAKFPACQSRRSEITLSALPRGEKVKLWKKEEESKADLSDDERPLDEIIQQSEDSIFTIKKSPSKSPLKAVRATLLRKSGTGRRRKLRCKKCEGCLSIDCGECVYCLDKPKFGGRGAMKQACIMRKCANPHYSRAATASFIQPKDDIGTGSEHSNSPLKDCDSTADNTDHSMTTDSPQKDSHDNKGGKMDADKLPTNNTSSSLIRRMILMNRGNQGVKPVSMDTDNANRTPYDVSRRLLPHFDGNSESVVMPSIQRHIGGISMETGKRSPLTAMGSDYQDVRSRKLGPQPVKNLLKGKDKTTLMRAEPCVLQPVGATLRQWTSLQPVASHKIMADYKENYGILEAWQQGVSLTMSSPLCVRTVCFLCGSAGKHDFIYCNVCCEPYHEFCLEDEERPNEENVENWCCQRCQFCNVCGHQRNLLKCDKCQNTYHPECLGPNYPTKPSKKKKIWVCTKCVRCKSCGATTPGSAGHATWMYDFQLCYECGQLMDKGNFCPICHKCYSDDDWESKMVQCVACESWVHAKCEGLTDEMYERVSYLPEDVHYVCKMCSPPDKPRHWELVLKDDFLAGIKCVLYTILNAKCAQHLINIEKKEDEIDTVMVDNLNKGNILESSTKILEHSPPKQQSTDMDCTETINNSQTEQTVSMETESCDSNQQSWDSKQKSCDSNQQLYVSDQMSCDSFQQSVDSNQQSCNLNQQICDSDQQSCDLNQQKFDSGECVLQETNRDNMLETEDVSVLQVRKDSAVQGKLVEEAEVQSSDQQIQEVESREGNSGKSTEREECSNCDNARITSEVSCDNELIDDSLQLDNEDEVDGNVNKNKLMNIESNDVTLENDSSCSKLELSSASVDKSGDISITHPAIDSKFSENFAADQLSSSCNKCDNDSQPDPNYSNVGPLKNNCEEEKVMDKPSKLDSTELKNDEIDTDKNNQEIVSKSEISTTDRVVNDFAEKISDVKEDKKLEIKDSDLCEKQVLELTPKKEQTTRISDSGEMKIVRSVLEHAHVRFNDLTILKRSAPTKIYPNDFTAIKRGINKFLYTTVEDFSEDMAHIINEAISDTDEQRIVRKKANQSVRSIFIKQMEKCFPWFNIKTCQLWEKNRNLPPGMLPDAVMPPGEDHTYAQWLEREDTPKSPQPSPFKKLQNTPIKRLTPIVAADEENVLSSDLEDAGEDMRRCILCWHYGDAEPNEAGRLLFAGQDDWIHINCALWSAEVYEEEHDGFLQNVHSAVSRGKLMKCDRCNRSGATVGCCTRGCPANYHFMCARLDNCIFQEDKKVFCCQHRDKVDGELVSKEKFVVHRRVCVDKRNMKKTWSKGFDAALINILIGACTVETLGHLTPASDCRGCLLPVDFCCTRVYWSTKDAKKRCVYSCRIVEVKPDSPKSAPVVIKDMTIIHDESHPDYRPLSEIDIPGINLFPKALDNSNNNNVIDLCGDDTDSSQIQITENRAGISGSSSQLSSSFGGQSLSTSVANEMDSECLSKSWPQVSRKRTEEKIASKGDLSLLSPKTLKLLNIKDPEKYISQKKPVVEESRPIPVEYGGPLTKIAERLNQAAAKNVQNKSEERKLPGSRPTSRGVRSRSNSVERIISPTHSRSRSRSNSADRESSPLLERFVSTVSKSQTISLETVSEKLSSAIDVSDTSMSSQPEMDSSNLNTTSSTCSADETQEALTHNVSDGNLEAIAEVDESQFVQETVIMIPEDYGDMTEEELVAIAQAALEQQEQLSQCENVDQQNADLVMEQTDESAGSNDGNESSVIVQEEKADGQDSLQEVDNGTTIDIDANDGNSAITEEKLEQTPSFEESMEMENNINQEQLGQHVDIRPLELCESPDSSVANLPLEVISSNNKESSVTELPAVREIKDSETVIRLSPIHALRTLPAENENKFQSINAVKCRQSSEELVSHHDNQTYCRSVPSFLNERYCISPDISENPVASDGISNHHHSVKSIAEVEQKAVEVCGETDSKDNEENITNTIDLNIFTNTTKENIGHIGSHSISAFTPVSKLNVSGANITQEMLNEPPSGCVEERISMGDNSIGLEKIKEPIYNEDNMLIGHRVIYRSKFLTRPLTSMYKRLLMREKVKVETDTAVMGAVDRKLDNLSEFHGNVLEISEMESKKETSGLSRGAFSTPPSKEHCRNLFEDFKLEENASEISNEAKDLYQTKPNSSVSVVSEDKRSVDDSSSLEGEDSNGISSDDLSSIPSDSISQILGITSPGVVQEEPDDYVPDVTQDVIASIVFGSKRILEDYKTPSPKMEMEIVKNPSPKNETEIVRTPSPKIETEIVKTLSPNIEMENETIKTSSSKTETEMMKTPIMKIEIESHETETEVILDAGHVDKASNKNEFSKDSVSKETKETMETVKEVKNDTAGQDPEVKVGGKFEDFTPIDLDGHKLCEVTGQFVIDEEEIKRCEEEKAEILKGLGLERTLKAKQLKDNTLTKSPLKTYPLRRRKQRSHSGPSPSKSEPETSELITDQSSAVENDSELPIHDRIARRIKAESLAKSTPGEKGPFKCQTCKRLYRTKESYKTHIKTCDFEVSTSDDEEEEEDKDTKKNVIDDATSGRMRYSVRERTVEQRKAMEGEKRAKEEEERCNSSTPSKKRGRPPKRIIVDMSPKVMLDRISPRKLEKTLPADVTLSSSLKKRRGRKPGIGKDMNVSFKGACFKMLPFGNKKRRSLDSNIERRLAQRKVIKSNPEELTNRRKSDPGVLEFKRRPGRPPKGFSSSPLIHKNKEKLAREPRKRGRPPRGSLSSDDLVMHNENEDVIPRKRGRPSKQDYIKAEVTNSEGIATKDQGFLPVDKPRKRGRPPKSSFEKSPSNLSTGKENNVDLSVLSSPKNTPRSWKGREKASNDHSSEARNNLKDAKSPRKGRPSLKNPTKQKMQATTVSPRRGRPAKNPRSSVDISGDNPGVSDDNEMESSLSKSPEHAGIEKQSENVTDKPDKVTEELEMSTDGQEQTTDDTISKTVDGEEGESPRGRPARKAANKARTIFENSLNTDTDDSEESAMDFLTSEEDDTKTPHEDETKDVEHVIKNTDNSNEKPIVHEVSSNMETKDPCNADISGEQDENSTIDECLDDSVECKASEGTCMAPIVIDDDDDFDDDHSGVNKNNNGTENGKSGITVGTNCEEEEVESKVEINEKDQRQNANFGLLRKSVGVILTGAAVRKTNTSASNENVRSSGNIFEKLSSILSSEKLRQGDDDDDNSSVSVTEISRTSVETAVQTSHAESCSDEKRDQSVKVVDSNPEHSQTLNSSEEEGFKVPTSMAMGIGENIQHPCTPPNIKQLLRQKLPGGATYKVVTLNKSLKEIDRTTLINSVLEDLKSKNLTSIPGLPGNIVDMLGDPKETDKAISLIQQIAAAKRQKVPSTTIGSDKCIIKTKVRDSIVPVTKFTLPHDIKKSPRSIEKFITSQLSSGSMAETLSKLARQSRLSTGIGKTDSHASGVSLQVQPRGLPAQDSVSIENMSQFRISNHLNAVPMQSASHIQPQIIGNAIIQVPPSNLTYGVQTPQQQIPQLSPGGFTTPQIPTPPLLGDLNSVQQLQNLQHLQSRSIQGGLSPYGISTPHQATIMSLSPPSQGQGQAAIVMAPSTGLFNIHATPVLQNISPRAQQLQQPIAASSLVNMAAGQMTLNTPSVLSGDAIQPIQQTFIGGSGNLIVNPQDQNFGMSLQQPQIVQNQASQLLCQSAGSQMHAGSTFGTPQQQGSQMHSGSHYKSDCNNMPAPGLLPDLSETKIPNTLVRIFVDGKPVAVTTDPSVLSNRSELLNQIGSSTLQAGTYSISVSSHKVPLTQTTDIEPVQRKAPTVRTVLPKCNNRTLQSLLSKGPLVKPACIGSSLFHKSSFPFTGSDTIVTSVANSYSHESTTSVNTSSTSLLTSVPNLSEKSASSALEDAIKNTSTLSTGGGSQMFDNFHTYMKKINSQASRKITKPNILNRKKVIVTKRNLEKNGILLNNQLQKGILKKLKLNSSVTSPCKKSLLKGVKITKGTGPSSLRLVPIDDTTGIRHKAVPAVTKLKNAAVHKKEVKRRKIPLKQRNVAQPHVTGVVSSHPIIHPNKDMMTLPQPAMEEEVTDSPLSALELENQALGDAKRKISPHLMFEISSDDGFHCQADNMQEAWRQVTERVQDARVAARMKQLSFQSLSGISMFGVNHNSLVYLIEQLHGAHNCRNYRFKFHEYAISKEEAEPAENPTGCIRTEAFQTRKPFDLFSFLMSAYRQKPDMDENTSDVEMVHKSSRRATSMDLPMAMRFRKLKEHSREAVGVYRSKIHGRGLYCKRNIDAGEMIIEYAGEVIRASLTDKREKYYESKINMVSVAQLTELTSLAQSVESLVVTPEARVGEFFITTPGIGCYMFRIDDVDVVDATLHGSAARFINHSCDPNCYSRVIQVDNKKHIVIFAMRAIRRGEELTYDYKFPIEEVKIPCTCGSKRCRKYLN